MATKEDIRIRRLNVAAALAEGHYEHEVIAELSAAFNVSKQTIRNDIKNKDYWAPNVIRIPDQDIIVRETLIALRELRRRLWQIVRVSKTGLTDKEGKSKWPFELPKLNDRIKAIITLIDLEMRSLIAQQSMGMVDKVPIKIDLQTRSKEFMTKIEDVCGDDKILQEKVALALYDVVSSN